MAVFITYRTTSFGQLVSDATQQGESWAAYFQKLFDHYFPLNPTRDHLERIERAITLQLYSLPPESRLDDVSIVFQQDADAQLSPLIELAKGVFIITFDFDNLRLHFVLGVFSRI